MAIPVSVLLVFFLASSAFASTCSSTGTSASYTEKINGNIRAISSNGCPNHQWVSLNPNSATTQNSFMNVPAYPQINGATTSMAAQGGAIGLALNGVAIYSCYGGASYGTCSQYTNSAVYGEGYTFDGCQGHPDSSGTYHYHEVPTCLAWMAGTTTGCHSPQLGWAADGFPIYGNYGPSGVLMKTCGYGGANSTYCLDSCGGYSGTLSGVDNFSYRYYMTGLIGVKGAQSSDFFPFTPLCLRGCCPSGVSCSTSNGALTVPTCSGSSNGYTSSYSPVAATGITSTCAPYNSNTGGGQSSYSPCSGSWSCSAGGIPVNSGASALSASLAAIVSLVVATLYMM